jgi:hypothetical protein
MMDKEASYQQVLAVLKVREVRETFEAVLRVVQEYCPTIDQTVVQVEAYVAVSNEYDDESYFNAYTLERFEVFTAERQRVPVIDPSSGEDDPRQHRHDW